MDEQDNTNPTEPSVDDSTGHSGTSGTGQGDSSAWQTKYEAAQAEVARMKDEKRKAKDKATTAKRKKDEEAALARGEFDKVKDDMEARLKDMASKVESYEAQVSARLETKISSLPDAAKAELELVRNTLDTQTLEKFVDLKLSGASKGDANVNDAKPVPPAPGVSTGGQARNTSRAHELHPETLQLLDRIRPEAAEIGKHLGSFDRGGEQVFRLGGTGDSREDILRDAATFIKFNNAIADDPMRARRDAARKRISEKLGSSLK